MEQKLAFQRYSQPPKKEQSFFSCLNCFSEPQYSQCIVGDKAAFFKNAQNSYQFVQKTYKQEPKVSIYTPKANNLPETSHQTFSNENKKDVISLKKSMKPNYSERQSLAFQQRTQIAHPYTDVPIAPKAYPLIIQDKSSKLVKSNSIPIFFQQNPKLQYSRSNVAFSYSRQSLPIQKLPIHQFQSKQSSILNLEHNKNGNLTKTPQIVVQTKSKKQKSQVSTIQENFDQPDKQMNKNQKKGNERNNLGKSGNFGNGKFHFQVRQTVSITEPDQQNIKESIVIEKTHFYQPKNVLPLKPITESELQAQSFIRTNTMIR